MVAVSTEGLGQFSQFVSPSVLSQALGDNVFDTHSVLSLQVGHVKTNYLLQS